MTTLIAIATAIALALLRGIGSIIGRETSGWCPHIARAVAQRAANLVEGERTRYQEEFAADLAEFEDRPLTMLLVAARTYISAMRLRRELHPPRERRPNRFEEWVFQRGLRSGSFRLCYYAVAPIPQLAMACLLHLARAPMLLQLLPVATAPTIWLLGAAVEVRFVTRGTRR